MCRRNGVAFRAVASGASMLIPSFATEVKYVPGCSVSLPLGALCHRMEH